MSLALPFPVRDAPSLDPAFDPARAEDLGRGAFVLHHRRFLRGADAVFAELLAAVSWRSHERLMYDRVVDVPRQLGPLPAAPPAYVGGAGAALERAYGVAFDRVFLALYRDGADSVAWHGDRLGALRSASIVAIVSLGGPRHLLVRPVGGGRSRRYDLGSGDLLVMGGTIQETFEHCVPKVARANPRIALMFRHSDRWNGRGAPVVPAGDAPPA